MDGSSIEESILHSIVKLSYEEPLRVPTEVNRKISRNRSLNSSRRRELKGLVFDSVRWRKRIWGDILPSRLKMDKVRSQLREIDIQARDLEIESLLSRSIDEISSYVSFPRFIVERWIKEFGAKDAVSLCMTLNGSANLNLRVNTVRSDRERVIQALGKEGVRCRPLRIVEHGVEVLDRVNIRGMKLFKRGMVDIQDGSSQFAVEKSKAEAGQLVVDACCGAGGKSLALAARMKGQGKILSVDSDARNFEELEKRAKRLGVQMIETMWVAAEEPAPLREYEKKADGLYVDVPCSSLGTLRRAPWLKWHWTPERLNVFPPNQKKILERFLPVLKPGGWLNYSTCTLHRQENQRVLHSFLEENAEYELLSENILRPDLHGTDGFYVACLRRNSS